MPSWPVGSQGDAGTCCTIISASPALRMVSASPRVMLPRALCGSVTEVRGTYRTAKAKPASRNALAVAAVSGVLQSKPLAPEGDFSTFPVRLVPDAVGVGVGTGVGNGVGVGVGPAV